MIRSKNFCLFTKTVNFLCSYILQYIARGFSDHCHSFPCENCALCGNYAQHISKVKHTEVIRCNTKYLNLKQK